VHDNNDIAIIGYSGHSLVVLDAANEAGIIISSYCEKNEKSFNPFNLKYLGDESNDHFEWETVGSVILSVGDNQIRKKLFELVTSHGKQFITVAHPHARISSKAEIGLGNFFAVNCIINAFACIGNNCILNTACVVEHECHIFDHVHIGPGAILAGNVTVGESSFIGANVIVKQGVEIGENTVVGAGSVVLQNIPSNEVWAGNPARKIK